MTCSLTAPTSRAKSTRSTSLTLRQYLVDVKVDASTHNAPEAGMRDFRQKAQVYARQGKRR